MSASRRAVCSHVLRLAVLYLGLCASAQGMEPIHFLDQPPLIDGELDAALASLPVEHFPVAQVPAGTKIVAPTFRLAYGTDFLYLYLEIDHDEIQNRDRAYQNGDGFQLVLSNPNPDGSSSREFYALGFTVSEHPVADWQKKFVWYHNVDLSFGALPDALLKTQSRGGKTGVELLIPWRALSPFHPWLSPAIGFNLHYVKAVGATQTADFFVVADDRIDSEQSPRKSTPLSFAKPFLPRQAQGYAQIETRHAQQGQTLQMRYALLQPEAEERQIQTAIFDGEGERLRSVQAKRKLAAGLNLGELALPTSDLAQGGYSLKLEAPFVASANGFTILPRVSLDDLAERLERASPRLSPGSNATMEFELEELRTMQKELKRDASANAFRQQLARFLDALQAAEHGQDLLAKRTGTFRRAYRSRIDGSLQPYTVRIPEKIWDGALHPTALFLHGSGEDDRTALIDGRFPADYIEIAPFGRGTSNAYTADHAQDDIREALDDLAKNYPVDLKRVLLSGFSMGGYGVYRSFHEAPERYRALAVFSGHPSLGRIFLNDETQPDFLDEKRLGRFRSMPVFIFHGGRDRNCPIELTRELIAKLRKAGAQVHFAYEEEAGHEYPSEESLEDFRRWLKTVMN